MEIPQGQHGRAAGHLPAPLTRSERLDRLPFTAQHRKLVVGSGTGWALDAMDVGLISFVMAALSAQWKLSTTELSWIASVGFIGMAIGASLGGLLADRIGRRQVFALTLLVVGWLIAALIGYFVVPASDDGWRWALAIGAVPAVYAVVVRYGLPESVRFLERRGRYAEAETVVRRFEDSAGLVVTDTPPSPSAGEPVAGETPGPGALWAPGLRGRTASLWVVWFGVNFSYYGAFIWIPTLLAASGMDLVKSFGYTLIITIAQLPGYAAAALLVELWGRRPTLSLFLAGSAGSALFFGNAESATAIIVSGMALSFFNLGAWGALYALSPDGRGVRRHPGGLRPDRVRARAPVGAVAARPRRRRGGLAVRGVRRVLPDRRGRDLRAARAARRGAAGDARLKLAPAAPCVLPAAD